MPLIPPITIAKVLEHIRQNDYVLPAIQREFVWSPVQITTLFDSLMQGYPIGTFLFWKIKEDHCQDFKFYQFLCDYHQRDQRHNPPVNVTNSSGVTSILDGQQRLTSLNIGLRGSYAAKKKYQWKKFDAAYPKKELYLNLLRPNIVQTGKNVAYEFRFLSSEKAKNPQENEHWFRVGDVLGWKNLNNVMNYLREHKLWEAKYPQQYLSTLFSVIHNDALISAYQEEDQNIEKVLNIFIRVNSGGMVLSYSDLLLSIATAQWKKRDAREEIHGFVGDLNRINRFRFTKDLVLKACLVLLDVPNIRFKVSNFTKGNIQKIEANWDKICGALRSAAILLARFGYDGSTLTARNVLIPVAYYMYFREIDETQLSQSGFEEDAREIRKWVRRALLKRGTFGAGVDTTLRTARSTIQEKCSEKFVFSAMESSFAEIGRSMRFEEEELDDLLDRSYGDGAAFSVLALLYPDLDFENLFHIDHIFPRAKFTTAQLRKAGIIDPKEVAVYQNYKDQVPNLQLLSASKNLTKGARMPHEWIADCECSDQWLERGYMDQIPEDMNGFGEFYEQRREKMKKRLAKLLDVRLSESAAVL